MHSHPFPALSVRGLFACLMLTAAAGPAAALPTDPLPFQWPQAVPAPAIRVAAAFDGNFGADLLSFDGEAVLRASHADRTFGAPVHVAVGSVAALSACDFDRDGLADLVYARGNQILMRRNLDGFTFAPAESVTVGALPNQLVIADLDADGWPDVAGMRASNDSTSVVLARNDGTGHWGATSLHRVSGQGSALVAIDLLDGGVPDLVVACTMWPPAANPYGQLWRLANLSAVGGTFAQAVTLTPSSGFGISYQLVAGDFDGDHHADLAYSMDGVTRLQVYFGHGDGSMDAAVLPVQRNDVLSTAPIPLSTLAGSGGRARLVTSERVRNFPTGAQGFSLFEWPAGRASSERTDYLAADEGGSIPRPLLPAADLDGDGSADLIFSGSVSSLVAFGSTDGTLSATLVKSPPANVSFAGSGDAIRVGQVREFGNNDVIESWRGMSYLLRNNARGVLADREPIGRGVIRSCRDLTGDGLADLVLATSDSVIVRESLGGGAFDPGTLYTGGTLVDMADVDADGDPDLFVLVADTLKVRRNSGGGNFGAPEPFRTVPIGLAGGFSLGDLDGDQRADLIVTDNVGSFPPSRDVTLLRQDGAGGFAAPQTFHTEGPGSSAYPGTGWTGLVGDLNGDGARDVVSWSGDNGVDMQSWCTILLGDGTGGYTALPSAFTGNSADPVRLFDLDGDARDELVAVRANGGSNNHLQVLALSSPGNTLITRTNQQCDEYPRNFDIADMNFDGRPDVVVQCIRRRHIDVLRNAVPNFATAVDLSLASAAVVDGHVQLRWFSGGDALASATLERSTDGTSWQELARLTPGGTGDFAYEDASVTPGARYGYRLAWIEAGIARTTAPAWVSVPGGGAFALRLASAHPASGDATLALALPRAGAVELRVSDIAGRSVWTWRDGAATAGERRITLPSSRWASGLYFVRATHGGVIRTARVVVTR